MPPRQAKASPPLRQPVARPVRRTLLSAFASTSAPPEAPSSFSPNTPPLATSSRSRATFRTALADWFQTHARDLPWRRTADPYAILVSELMLQQTQVTTVIPYYERWLARFPTVQSLAAASESEVLSLWQGLGYYSRARNLHRAAQHVVATHGGHMPRTVAELRALPGVGAYTAGAIASFAYDLPVAAVDGNIARVLARLFDIREPIDAEEGRSAVWDAAGLLLPRAGGRLHTGALMELGALICTARQPRCLVCPMRKHCAAKNPESLPAKRPRRGTVALLEECAWVVSERGLLLERQDGTRWRGLWKLPRLGGGAPAAEARVREQPAPGELLFEDVYPFTHHRVTLRVYRGCSEDSPLESTQAWFAGEALREVALAAAHRRAVEALTPAALR